MSSVLGKVRLERSVISGTSKEIWHGKLMYCQIKWSNLQAAICCCSSN